MLPVCVCVCVCEVKEWVIGTTVHGRWRERDREYLYNNNIIGCSLRANLIFTIKTIHMVESIIMVVGTCTCRSICT